MNKKTYIYISEEMEDRPEKKRKKEKEMEN